MSMLLILVLAILLFGDGGYYGYNRCGSCGLGGILGLILAVFVILCSSVHWAISPSPDPGCQGEGRKARGFHITA